MSSSVLICVAFIDLEHMLVFDRFVVILAALGVVAVFFDPNYGWLSHLIGGAVGFGFFYGIHALFYYGLKKDALGGGDIKLAAAAGVLLGWQCLLLSILLASVSASVILVIWSKKRMQAEEETEEGQEGEENPLEFPFAPFLCAGFFLALSFGAPIIRAYLGLLGL